jgi:WD40 repeat protein
MLVTNTKTATIGFLLLAALGAGILARQALADKAVGVEIKRKQPDKPPAQPKAVQKKDAHGDPLPFGAKARLGTVRFRHDSTCVAYSPDGSILASGGADNRIRLFDPATGKEIRRLAGHKPREFDPDDNRKSAFAPLVRSVGAGNVTCIVFSPDGKMLASGGWDDTIRLWDVNTGAELRKIYAHQAMVAAVVFSPDGKALASRGGLDGSVRLWSPRTGNVVHTFEGLTKVNPWRFNRTAGLAFSPDSKTLAAGDKNVIRFWDVAGGKEKENWKAHLSTLCIAFSRVGARLASGGVDGKDKNSIRIWDVKAGKELRRCQLLKDEPPIHLDFSSNGDKLAVVVEEDDMHLYDVSTGKHLHRLEHYWASRIAYAPDGKAIASARGRTIRLWDPITGKELFTEFEGHRSGITAVALSPNGKLVASGGDNIRLWQADTGALIHKIEVKGFIAAVAFSPDSKTLASAGRDRAVRLWDTASGKPTGELKGHNLVLCGVAFSPNGQYLASGDIQSTIRIWEVKTGKILHTIDMQSGTEALSLAFSPDSKSLACGGAWNDSSFLPKGVFIIQGVKMIRKEGTYVLQWDLKRGKEVRRFGGLEDKITSIAFSRDGTILAASSHDGKIGLWDTATGKERLYIAAHPSPKNLDFSNGPSVAFAPDGKLLALAGTDGTIRFWDAATAKARGQIHSRNGGFTSIAFSQSGKTLVSGSADSTVMIWDWAKAVRAPQKKDTKVIYIK